MKHIDPVNAVDWVVLLQAAFLVNSAAHVWGYQTYETGDLSTNNWWVALLAGGECKPEEGRGVYGGGGGGQQSCLSGLLPALHGDSPPMTMLHRAASGLCRMWCILRGGPRRSSPSLSMSHERIAPQQDMSHAMHMRGTTLPSQQTCTYIDSCQVMALSAGPTICQAGSHYHNHVYTV